MATIPTTRPISNTEPAQSTQPAPSTEPISPAGPKWASGPISTVGSIQTSDPISAARLGLVRRGPGRWRAGSLAAALAGLALLVAACGNGESSGTAVASVPSASSSASQAPGAGQRGDPVKYSQCMRSHGVPKFPDPNAQGGLAIDGSKLGLDPRSAQFKAAEAACKSLMPQGPPPDPKQAAAGQQMALAYSRCMRSHGVKNFPDPKLSSGGVELTVPRSINLNSAQFKAADKACKKLMPGGGQTDQSGPGGSSQSGGGNS
jgi:hypothetical protein